MRPVLIACATGLLILLISLSLSILNVGVLPEPQQAIAAIEHHEGIRPTEMMPPGRREERIRVQSAVPFSDRWFGGQSEILFSDRWLRGQAVTLQIPGKSSQHAATTVTSFTE